MDSISNNFCGFLKIDGDEFAYSVTNHVVTLLPTDSTDKKKSEKIDAICKRNQELTEYYCGTDNNSLVAFIRSGAIRRESFFSSTASFAAPYILRARGNAEGFFSKLSKPWDLFHAITFVGGSINAVFDPQVAQIIPSREEWYSIDGAFDLKTRPWEDYTLACTSDLFGESTKISVSVTQSFENRAEDGTLNLGALNSYIQFSFEKPHSLNDIPKIYDLVKSFLALLLRNQDVSFSFYLSQRLSDGKLFTSAIGKRTTLQKSSDTRPIKRAIPISTIFPWVTRFLNNLLERKYDIILCLIPESKDSGYLSFSNVQDICTALEVAYSWTSQTRKKDELIAELKRVLKGAIKEFVENRPELDIIQTTNISSAFQHLDYTQKNKVLTLASQDESYLKQARFSTLFPPINEENVQAFIKLRNNKTHSGILKWDKSVELYVPLLGLLYIELLKDIGADDKTISLVMKSCF